MRKSLNEWRSFSAFAAPASELKQLIAASAELDQLSYYRTHPPRCIAGFEARPAELLGHAFDGHAELRQHDIDMSTGVSIEAPRNINTMFVLSCRCGGDRHYVHGHRWINVEYHNAVVTLSPLVLECAECGVRTPLLDTDVHGYDAEFGYGSATVRGEGDRVVIACEQCGRNPLNAFVRFEYSDDLFDEDFRQFAGREQDLFSWFTLVGQCPQCSRRFTVAEFECA